VHPAQPLTVGVILKPPVLEANSLGGSLPKVNKVWGSFCPKVDPAGKLVACERPLNAVEILLTQLSPGAPSGSDLKADLGHTLSATQLAVVCLLDLRPVDWFLEPLPFNTALVVFVGSLSHVRPHNGQCNNNGGSLK